MTDVYRVRRARPEDLPRLAPLWRRLVEYEALLSPRFAVKADAEKHWLEELTADREAGRAEVFLVESTLSQDGRPLGFLHVRATRGAPFHAEDRLGFVDSVWVEPTHRRVGLAKRLVEEAETWCRQRRLTVLEAGVVTANKEAVAAWEKLGFRMTSAVMTRAMQKDPRAGVARSFDAQAPRIAASPYFTFEKRVRRLVDFARPDPTHRLLDVGCGTGVLLAAFATRAGGRVGVEVSAEMARRAKAAGAEVVLAAAEHLPFRNGSFHRVVTRATVHHLVDVHAGLHEMARVAAARGAVVVEDLVTSEDAARAEKHNALERLRDASHQRMLSASELTAAFEKAGLRVDDTLAVREPRDVESWLAIAAPPPEVADNVRALARGYAAEHAKDETGLAFRIVGEEVRFDHTHLLVRGVKG